MTLWLAGEEGRNQHWYQHDMFAKRWAHGPSETISPRKQPLPVPQLQEDSELTWNPSYSKNDPGTMVTIQIPPPRPSLTEAARLLGLESRETNEPSRPTQRTTGRPGEIAAPSTVDLNGAPQVLHGDASLPGAHECDRVVEHTQAPPRPTRACFQLGSRRDSPCLRRRTSAASSTSRTASSISLS